MKRFGRLSRLGGGEKQWRLEIRDTFLTVAVIVEGRKIKKGYSGISVTGGKIPGFDIF